MDRRECDGCGESFDRDDLIPTDSGVLCEACFEEIEGDLDDDKRTRAEEELHALRREYEELLYSVDAIIWKGDAETLRFIFVSHQAEAILGHPVERWTSEPSFWADHIHPEDREWVMSLCKKATAEKRSHGFEYRMITADGGVVWLRDVVHVAVEGGVPKRLFGVMVDVTERKLAEKALRESEERYRTVVEEQTDLVCRFLPDKTLTFVNDAYCRYFGEGPEELIGSSFMRHIPEEDHAYYEKLSQLSRQNPVRTVEHRVFTPGGEVRWQQWTDRAIFNKEGRLLEYQSVGRDVTDRKALEERLEHRAFHDSLTDLPNRQLFVDRLGQALRHTRRQRSGVAVLFMDLDGFKVINDSLGHEAGDLFLIILAERLRRCSRPEDTLARFGGDEFTVLLADVGDPAEAIRVAERITSELRRPFVLEGRELFASASIGIALGTASTKSPEELLREADTAMYRAKEEDTGGYRVFDPAMYERAVKRLNMENDLRRAMEAGELMVRYQPIVNLQTGEAWGVEALVRWDHPERGLLDPSEFVPMAEESGLIIPVGERVLEEACRRAAQWQRDPPRTPPLFLSVNLSARQLRRPDLAETVEGVLEKTRLDARCLSLDVTETVYIKVLEGNTVALDALKRMGVCISIDDFGVGYSSLAYLKRLPADALKIDKSFVEGLGEDIENTAIVRMVIDLAHTVGMEVVAEGVEDADQAAQLREMGCDFGQGFHFSEALPPEAVPEFLAG